MTTIASKAIKSSLYVASTSYFLQIAGIAFTIILARLLEPEQFGVIALATVIYGYIARARLFGFNYILIHKKDKSDELLSTHLLLQTILTLATIVISISIAPFLIKLYNFEVVEVLLIIALASLFDAESLSSTPQALLQKELEYKKLSVINVGATLISKSVAVILAFLGFGVWALVAMIVSDILIRFVSLWRIVTWKPSFIFDKQVAKSFFEQGKHLWLSGVSSFVVFSFDDLLVGSFVGLAALGFYAKAYEFSKLPMGLITGALQVALPTYSKLQDDRVALSNTYTMMLDIVALASFPMSVILAATAPEFIPLLIGDKWLPAVPLLQLLILYSFLRPIMDGTFSLPIAMGMPKILSAVGIVQTLLMVFLCTILTYLYGAAGAAISAGIVVLVGLTLISKYFVVKHLDVDYIKIFVPSIMSLMLAVSGTFIMLHYYPISNMLLRFIFKIVTIGVIYIFVLYNINGKEIMEKGRYIYRLIKEK